jgi:predicted flap endonuclease-1-like 5' DNA nuclease
MVSNLGKENLKMCKILRPRFLLIGLLILLWLWVKRQEESRQSPIKDKPLEIEVPPEAPPEFDVQVPSDAATPEPEVDREAQTADEPEPDDLRRIEGIGPKISAVLLEAGVSTYKQLSVMGIEQIRELLDAGGIRVARPDTWPEQAQLAADADWQALEKLQGELKGGRRA